MKPVAKGVDHAAPNGKTLSQAYLLQSLENNGRTYFHDIKDRCNVDVTFNQVLQSLYV